MKRILLGNLGTKAMALFLAILTWGYIHMQGMGSEEIAVQFNPPALDPAVFADAVWMDSKGHEIAPGSTLRVRINGPKSEVRSLFLRPPLTFKCEPVVNLEKLDQQQGSHPFTLDQKHFTIPSGDKISLSPLLPSPELTLRYAKYAETTIDLVANKFYYEGQPAPGYKVESITVLPSRIRVKVPAGRPDKITRFDIKRVPVYGKLESIPPTSWELDPEARRQNVFPLEDFKVEVKIVPNTASRTIKGLPLSKNVPPGVSQRIELETQTVDIELQGPEELVDEAAKLVAAFAPYVLVTERDLEPPGPKNLTEIGCHILDPRFRGKITVVVMPNEKPENRQIKVKVLPK